MSFFTNAFSDKSAKRLEVLLAHLPIIRKNDIEKIEVSWTPNPDLCSYNMFPNMTITYREPIQEECYNENS